MKRASKGVAMDRQVFQERIERLAIECEIFPNPDREWLAREWKTLQSRANDNVFLSWLWIGTWLDTLVDDFVLIEARLDNQIVGLGILIGQSRQLLGQHIGDKFHLHRTGCPMRDQMWIEYNDFLLDAEHEADTRQAMLERLYYWLYPNDILVVGASHGRPFNALSELGMVRNKNWDTTTYSLDLTEIRNSGKQFLATLSKNTRYQIRRSERRYRELGEMRFDQAKTLEHAQAMFDAASPFHLARWGNGRMGSGFNNPYFLDFHDTLIARGIASGEVELFELSINGETEAIIYNLKHGNRVYFYLCAINYHRDSNQFKPGLLCHYFLIEQALKEGVDVYDFMGGTARYKSTFSSHQSELAVYQFEHPGMVLSTKNTIRSLKHRVTHRNNHYYP